MQNSREYRPFVKAGFFVLWVLAPVRRLRSPPSFYKRFFIARKKVLGNAVAPAITSKATFDLLLREKCRLSAISNRYGERVKLTGSNFIGYEDKASPDLRVLMVPRR